MAAAAQPRRKPTNVSIREDILDQARSHGLNISRIAEDALTEAIREKQRQRWLAENAEAIAYQNRLAEEEGAFGDDVRTF